MAAYKAIGGLEGALKNRADEVLGAFDDAQRELCRRIFLSLTQPGEGTEDTKRRASFGELVSAGADPRRSSRSSRRLADARLITTARGPDRPEGGLGRGGPRGVDPRLGQLRQWIDADRAGLRTHRRLTEAAREWEQHGRDPGFLYAGARLATAREWSESHPGELNPAEVDFLAAGISAERRKRDDEVDRGPPPGRGRGRGDRAREAFARVQEHVRNLPNSDSPSDLSSLPTSSGSRAGSTTEPGSRRRRSP